jgi:hypothetical protein
MTGRTAKARRPHFVRRCYTALSGCFFTIQRKCVYCAVRTGTLNIIRVNLSLQIGPSPVRIIPPTLHTHLRLHAALTKMTNGRSLRTFKRNSLSEIGGELDRIGLSLVLQRNQQDATLYNIPYCYQCSTCFRAVFPLIRALTTITNIV